MNNSHFTPMYGASIITMATFVDFSLKVLGAVGAIWGSSDVMKLRDEENRELWAMVAGAVGGVALLSYCVQSVMQALSSRVEESAETQPVSALVSFPYAALRRRCIPQQEEGQYTALLDGSTPSLAFKVTTALIGLSLKWVLEVAGAVGAIWGPSDAFFCRNEVNRRQWAYVSQVVGCAAILRQFFHAHDAKKERVRGQNENVVLGLSQPYRVLLSSCGVALENDSVSSSESAHKKVILNRLLAVFEVVMRFILEVLGAAGAIWGSSEALALRHGQGDVAWRATSAAIGGAALVCFLMKAQNEINHTRESSAGSSVVVHPYTTLSNSLEWCCSCDRTPFLLG